MVKSSPLLMDTSRGTMDVAWVLEAGGEVHRREEEDWKVAVVVTEPNLHRIEAPPKLAPVTVTTVDPAIEPEAGEMVEIAGDEV